MLTKPQLAAIDIHQILTDDLTTPDERKEVFNDLSTLWCFTCGHKKEDDGSCPCLEEHIAKLNEEQDRV